MTTFGTQCTRRRRNFRGYAYPTFKYLIKGLKGREGNGRERGGKGKWYPHFLGESYCHGTRSLLCSAFSWMRIFTFAAHEKWRQQTQSMAQWSRMSALLLGIENSPVLIQSAARSHVFIDVMMTAVGVVWSACQALHNKSWRTNVTVSETAVNYISRYWHSLSRGSSVASAYDCGAGGVWLNTAKDRKGPQRTAKEHYTGPQRIGNHEKTARLATILFNF